MRFVLIMGLLLGIIGSSTAQFTWGTSLPAFSARNSGFDLADLHQSKLLVVRLEPPGADCSNSPILRELNFEIVPVVAFCPAKGMTKKERKQVEKFGEKHPKFIGQQEALWYAYPHAYQLVDPQELTEAFSDVEQYPYVLHYQYVYASNSYGANANPYFTVRYVIENRGSDRQYATLRNLDTTTDLKKLGNLSRVIKLLGKE